MSEHVKSACVPCAIGHFATSAKLLGEAVRFKKDGMKSPQVLDDIASALGEQNALERIDLTPAKIRILPDWEKDMAQMALDKSRDLRHRLETVKSMEELENIAADTEEFFRMLNRDWASKRMEDCPTCSAKAEELKSALTHVDDGYSLFPEQKRRQFIDEIRRRK